VAAPEPKSSIFVVKRKSFCAATGVSDVYRRSRSVAPVSVAAQKERPSGESQEVLRLHLQGRREVQLLRNMMSVRVL
jgi:hypothetical protein